MSRDYKVVEVSWTLGFSVIMILDLKRHKFRPNECVGFSQN